MKRLIFLTVVASLLLAPVVTAQEWNIDIVDNEGNAGAGSKTWIDVEGKTNIVYWANDNLYHAVASDSGGLWSKEVIYNDYWPVTKSFDAIGDELGNVHVSFVQAYGWELHYLSSINGVWSEERIGGIRYSVLRTSIAVDSLNSPHIVISHEGNLKHWYLDGSWREESVVDAEVGSWCSMAIDSNDHIYVAYNTTAGHLRMAYYNGSSWAVDYVDVDGDDSVGEYCDLIIDDDGVPHIAYYDATNGQLKHATLNTTP